MNKRTILFFFLLFVLLFLTGCATWNTTDVCVGLADVIAKAINASQFLRL